jgi:hypothetical protein
VDFCTELLTYQRFFEKICNRLGIYDSHRRKEYATRMKDFHSRDDRGRYLFAAITVLQEDFPDSADHNKVAEYLWNFVSNYNWWAGSKTVDRHDFYISPILNQLNVVNASSEFLAEIVLSYSSDIRLRRMVERLDDFVINVTKNNYLPSIAERESYEEAEEITIPERSSDFLGISISAASLERFHLANQ